MTKSEIERLERQGCFSDDWSLVDIADGTDLGKIRNVWFRGPVSVGAGTSIVNVPGGISNARIGKNARIENVARIINAPGARFGMGTDVNVLDETGGRPVRIYPGLSAQVAALAARMPEYASESLLPLIDRHIAEMDFDFEIGDGAEITDCGPMLDVRVWPGVKVEGAALLRNGSIVSNAPKESCLAYAGQGVNAKNFIIEDASAANGVVLRNTYAGQGTVLDKGFTSHDSLFFANCAMENGEACAVFAGPYTVSMHKSSLLIGCQTAFMNAGSGTNMSNHMYKVGPVHWGVMERGVKTSSNSYVMHGSRIGAFSLVMGDHKTHPDTSEFPFSYLFGDGKGKTTVVPGAMLRSYGLKRDGEKWPNRDRRLGHCSKLADRIDFRILNPYTVDMILRALHTIDSLLDTTDDGNGSIAYKSMTISRSSLIKGKRLYELSVNKYLHKYLKKAENGNMEHEEEATFRWIDLSGLVLTESELTNALRSKSIKEMEMAFDKAVSDTDRYEQAWIAERLKDYIDNDKTTAAKASELDSIIEKDRTDSISQIARENDMLSLN